MLKDFFLKTKMGVVFSGLLSKTGQCGADLLVRRVFVFSMVLALSACGGSDDSPVVAVPKDGSEQPKIQVFDFTKAQPTLSAIAGNNQVMLNWDAIPNSASYTLCHATQSLGEPADLSNCAAYTSGTLVPNITNTMHTATGLDNSTTYYFALVAVDGNGNQSLPSAQISAVPVPTVARGKLNDTGITWGGNYPSSNNTDCSGDDIGQQDCSHGRDVSQNDNSDGYAGFSFTKLDSDGTALVASADQWSCVQDNITGFIWEVKTTDGGLHDAGGLYSWYNTDSSTNGGAVGAANNNGTICEGYANDEPASYCNTQAFAARVNAAELCGAEDWRTPTIKELSGIVHHGIIRPAIDTEYFPNTASADYFSSSANANNIASEVWVMNFNYGFDYKFGYETNYFRVRLVSSGQ